MVPVKDQCDHQAAAAPILSGVPAASELFRSIVDEAQDGMIILSSDGRVLYANSGAEFLLGRGRGEMIGETFDLVRAVPESTTNVNVISSDGGVRLVELRIEPLPAGPPGSLIIRLKDITTYHQDAAKAREQVQRRDQFLSMLSHEVRNPLAAIRGAGSLLAQDGLHPEMRRMAAEIFDRQFRHLTRLLDDLLDVARISRGKLEIIKERVDLKHAVCDAIEEANSLIRMRQHYLHVDLPAHEVWVEGDGTRLEQVVVNLLNNAVKFTPPRGNISVSLVAGPKEAEICVRDDGPGIPDELLPHIFEPFVQGKQSLARSEGGLGIGLALVQTIVRRHGGTVAAHPNPDGRGVCFTVKLPVVEAGAERTADQECSADQGRMPADSLRVLLIEDVEDSRHMLRQLLVLDGYEVLEAADGPKGLAALLAEQPDVALVDIGLPGMDGYELARQARRDARGRQVRLIAVTGYGMPRDVRAAREAGFDGHLIKPVRYPDLVKLLHRLLRVSNVPASGHASPFPLPRRNRNRKRKPSNGHGAGGL